MSKLWEVVGLKAAVSAGIAIVSAHLLQRRAATRRAAGSLDCDLLAVVDGQWTPCHWLAHRGHAMLLRLTLQLFNGCGWWSSPNAMATQQRWTPLHCAATQGHASSVKALVGAGASIDVLDMAGHSALAIAVARGHRGVVNVLLNVNACPNTPDAKQLTPLHFAAIRGDAEIVTSLLSKRALADAQDTGGYTPLLVACAKAERESVALCLLKHKARVDVATYGQCLSVLMLVCKWDNPNSNFLNILMEQNADPSAVDAFGQTALHLACRRGQLENITALCKKHAPAAAQDNDGQYPLQLLCACSARAPDDRELVDIGIRGILRADPDASTRLDFSDATPLHTLLLLAGVEKSAPVYAVRALLEAQADPTLEDESGFTAAHYAAQAGVGSSALSLALRECGKISAEFWEAFDPTKRRDLSNRKYLSRRGGHHRIPIEERKAVLNGNASLQGVARLVAEGRCRRIVALVGAGASTGAGVPDFRSQSGLWSQESTRELLSLDGLMKDPVTFWRKVCDLFFGRKPTKAHALLARLAKEGMLSRIYTQNIDGLERSAGIPDELIIECHGSVMRSVCSADSAHELKTSSADIAKNLSDCDHTDTSRDLVPRCWCGAVVRPDVTFFGEALPTEFARRSGEDMAACDLLIVIGTSLNVYPVAGLVNRVSPLTPRLLLNQEAVAVWRGCESNAENYRDVFAGGDCEVSASEFANVLGWEI